MNNIPDAPWIVDAETNGVGYAPPIYCPVCGREDPDDLYIDDTSNDVVGCNLCVKTVDAWEWLQDHKEILE